MPEGLLESLLTAVGLVLILEGLLPLAAPARWREFVTQVARFADGQIRFMGLGAVALGLLLVLI